MSMLPVHSSQGSPPAGSSGSAPRQSSDPERSLAFPHCQIQGGICDRLLTSLPFAIFGLQFVRDDRDAVQDGIVIFSNSKADAYYGRKLPNGLRGAMFFSSIGDSLPFGAWQRMLWIAACGRPEIIHLGPLNSEVGDVLVVAPYRDGLIISRSLVQLGEEHDKLSD
jgi:hypothetical protein